MYQSHGRVTIDPEVLVTIARLTTLAVPGVARLVPGGVRDLLRRPSAEGVQIAVQDNSVCVDLYIAVQADQNLRDIARAIQDEVTRAIRDMVGMDVAAINVHIEDVDFPVQPASGS
jgi:uncharacterized alkaline shock family protein YloU